MANDGDTMNPSWGSEDRRILPATGLSLINVLASSQ
jgi:hypothetical protein